MIEKLEGIIISERDYGDTSKILNVLTKKYGIIGVISKGCKNLKSDLRSVSSKLTYGIFNIYYKENKLSTLVSVDIINSFKNIKKDLMKLSYSGFLLELTEQVMKQSMNDDIYDILISGLIKINECFDYLVITNIIELKYLDYLGVMPIIDCCSNCGNKTSIATLSSDMGGYVCNNCLNNEPVVSEKTIKLIRMFYYVDINKITKLEVREEVKKEINEFIDLYYERYSGLYLKSKSFLRSLSKIG